LKATKKFVKTVDQLQESDPGFKIASKIERRDNARNIEREIQEIWKKEGTFTANSGERKEGGGKFMCTFPYPYMNGRLHLGHAFSLTKADFAAGYHRLKGRAVLFPFSFHCTGMPIQASSVRLTREIESGKIKSASKEEGLTQYEILLQLGIDEAEIPKFKDPLHWLGYFPPKG